MDALTTPLPKDWEIKTFRDISTINQGLQIPISQRLKAPTEHAKFYITIQALNNRKEFEYIKTYNESVVCHKDDILMTRTGNTGMVITNIEGVFHNNFFKINFDRTLINKDFLVYFLSLEQTQKTILKKAGTSTIPDLNHNDFYSLLIPLPPLNEQIAIANILSGLDRYLYSLDALILKKESVKKALSFELLSQRKRLKGFNQAWQRVRLGTYKYRRGSFPQPYGNPQWYSDNGMPFVQVYDVGENFKLTQKTKQKISKIAQPMSVFVPKNSVIITLQGTIGRVALTQYDCYCDRTILIFDNNTLNDVNKYFFVLSLFTKFEEEKRKADGSIIKTITKQTLKDFEIPLPPLNEQIAIANILSALDHEIISLKNKKRQFENIKKALNHDLMSAKIRVLKK
ncbi:restriction endonuclease subunit S [Helicobacter pylori]|uniref:restriction endonuclease subunit S n=1 Tax=Helicobacter pylori TaxID=210 RepID=UPI00025AC8A3|nr:restriction endonuclease subunit S [Helicobacter pylori]EIE28370.1 restriction modification system DNA specificity domain protein [Helicobacter pylori NCTC 11637 = CCUG 17874 = ATCC 43504 = JCM 12093]MBM0601905.1 restriction endonuclease subunit S [Helicobacter pylori]MBM0609310.1 restriction endonuclease subunit S [Helicobacter pylori]MBM0618485.1 restriction endonuclease subunit S [Helicobacter pylori]MBM0625759.1 restriction endonuclease subunit S [Helicobacter pylori]